MFAEGTELRIEGVFLSQSRIGEFLRRTVFHHPKVCIGTALQHAFGFHRYTAGLRIVGSDIATAGIGNDARHIAPAAGHIPRAVFRPVHHHAWSVRAVVRRCLPFAHCAVSPFFFFEKTVSHRAAAYQTAIKAHPFGASEWGDFHVIGTAHRRNADLLNRRGAFAVERRIPPGVDAGRFHTFHIGRRARTEIGELRTPQAGRNDKSSIAYPHQAIGRTETQQQSRMHRALRQDATTGHFYHRARVRHVGRGAAPHQGVFSTHTRRVPGIEHRDSFVVRTRFDAQPSRIAQSSAVERSCTAGHTEPQAADQRKQCPTPPLHVVSRVTSPASEVFIFALTTSRSVSRPSRNMSFATTASTVMSRPLSTPASMRRNEVS